MPNENKKGVALFWWFVLAGLIIVLDQVTKLSATYFLEYARPVYVLPVFDLTLLHNKGAAFSFLSNAGGWQRWFFTAIAVGVSAVLVVWLTRLPRHHTLTALSLALILGGAIGNLIDRVYLGYVVDFISVHWDRHYFPAFNIADSAICVGAGLMLFDSFFVQESEQDDKQS